MRSLLSLCVGVALALTGVHARAFQVLHSVEDVATVVETSTKVHAVLIVSSAQDAKLQDLANNGDDALVDALSVQFPHVAKIAQSLDDTVQFVIADIPEPKAIAKKWNIATLPALVLYKDAPKVNPYTRKMYREAALTNVAVLEQPSKLKKLLKDSIPSTYVTDWNAENAFKALSDVDAFVKKNTEDKQATVVVLVSKQKAPSHLYRALSVEFQERGLAFAYLKHDEAVGSDVIEQWQLESLPSLVVIKQAGERHVLAEDKMKTYADLKNFVEPFASAVATSEDTTTKQDAVPDSKTTMPLLTASNFEEQVLKSKLIWIVAFMDAEAEANVDKQLWKKLLADLQKKAGIVTVGGVSCASDPELCEQHGGPGVRVFTIKISGEHDIERDDALPNEFKSIEDAKQAAIDSIPNVVQVMGSSAELNAFIARAMAVKAMPVLLVTNKPQTPAVLKALALSFPTQNLAVAVISDADPQVKRQFNIDPSTSTTVLCLVAVEKKPDQPDASPFGIVTFDKKTMGPYTYANLVHFLMSVLSTYPHPLPTAEGESADSTVAADDEPISDAGIGYLRKDNRGTLCDGNKICAIGFFDGHIDTLKDEDSSLSKSIAVLRQVATKSKKNRQPFHFMWTNGKCQSAFAEAFGVGAFQMPTIVVYSPSKERYATNVGLFDEENTYAFLKSVLSGKIATIPVNSVPELRNECSFEEVHDDVAAIAGEEDDDLGDLLSEILGDEAKQRRELEEQLKSEKKSNPKKEKKNKKKKKKSKKKSDKDEL